MEKKIYMTPASNEARTRLRTGLLAGSNTINFDSNGNASLNVNTEEKAALDGTNKVVDARQRGTLSID